MSSRVIYIFGYEFSYEFPLRISGRGFGNFRPRTDTALPIVTMEKATRWYRCSSSPSTGMAMGATNNGGR